MSEANERLDAKLVEHLLKTSRSSPLAIAILGPVIGLLHGEGFNWFCTLWCVSLVAMCIARYKVIARDSEQSISEDELATIMQRFHRWLIGTTVLVGIGVIFFAPDAAIERALLATILTSYMTAASFSLSASRSSMLIFFVLIVAPVLSVLLYNGTNVDLLVASLVTLYIPFSLRFAQQYQKALRQAFELSDDKQELLQRIQEESTRLSNINTDLEAAVAESKHAEEIKGQFLANMSHEIRTPMNGVLGMNALLLESGLNDDQHGLALNVKKAGETLLEVINDILDFSKIEAGQLKLENASFCLAEEFKLLEPLFEVQCRDRDIELIFELQIPETFHVVGDSLRLRQVLINLIGNAIKFTSSGGVMLRVEMVKDESTAEPNNVMLRFAVIDTGIGIAPKQQSRILDAFSQADPSITRRFGGTGLGLTISSQLIRMMGGELEIKSIAKTGSVFFFSLPFERAKENGESEDDALVEQNLARAAEPRRILVAEDNKINQMLIVRLLEKLGHSVVLTADGQEAVDSFITDNKFDLILMDIQMPRMDGEEALKRIRKLEKGDTIPIIALTAHAMEGDKQRYLDVGFDDYVSKPIDRSALEKSIAKA